MVIFFGLVLWPDNGLPNHIRRAIHNSRTISKAYFSQCPSSFSQCLFAMPVFLFEDSNSTQTTSISSSSSGIMIEIARKPEDSRNYDQPMDKGLAAQRIGANMLVTPFTITSISTLVQRSAQGAADQCSGGIEGTICGQEWSKTDYDGRSGLRQELSALNVVLANLAVNAPAPVAANATSPQSPSSAAPGSTSPASTSTQPILAKLNVHLRLGSLRIAGQSLSLMARAVLLLFCRWFGIGQCLEIGFYIISCCQI